MSSTQNIVLACTGIIWDTDGELAETLGLPDNVVIDNPTDEMIEDCDNPNDAVVNYLSDEYGFCIEGYNLNKCTVHRVED